MWTQLAEAVAAAAAAAAGEPIPARLNEGLLQAPQPPEHVRLVLCAVANLSPAHNNLTTAGRAYQGREGPSRWGVPCAPSETLRRINSCSCALNCRLKSSRYSAMGCRRPARVRTCCGAATSAPQMNSGSDARTT